MRNQRYGIEIEMTGITRAQAANCIAQHFGTRATHIGGIYDAYTVRDSQERIWKVMSDGSIRTENSEGGGEGRLYAVEVVSPICVYDDIPTVQEIVRSLRRSGAVVNETCGIHVHVDAEPFDAKTLRNLVNIIAAKEELLYKALQVEVSRESFCKKTDPAFLEEINRRKTRDMTSFEEMWYGGGSRRDVHYDSTRYHALNLHSVFQKGTVEFRLFNSTLHAGKVKSYIQLCLAISHQALTQRRASYTKTQSENEKYTFRTWLLHLGLIGDEFKTARGHLLAHLEGNVAWKDPTRAAMQKKRLQEKQSAGVEPAENTSVAGSDQESAEIAHSVEDPLDALEPDETTEELEEQDEGPVLSM